MASKVHVAPVTAEPPDPVRSPTVFDVAREVGCSIATVSRALNQPDRVGPEIRARVVAAALRLRYVPNGSARALRSAKSRLMGAVIPTLSHAIYARMIENIQSRLATVGVSLLHVAVGYDLKLEAKHVRMLLEQGIEGLVLVGAHHRPESFHLLRDREIPFVVTYAVGGPGVPFVGFDNRKAGMMAARYLVDLGHRRLGMLAGITRNNDRAGERVRGFLDAAAEMGLGRDVIEIVEAPYRMDSGEAALGVILDRRPDITAVFCGSDILAVGAMKACRQRGLRVPQDLSIIGFDNLEVAEYLSPALTTIAIPAETMGTRSAEFLLADPADRQLHSRVELETQLILRETTAPPRRRG
ncbi:MAG TPA: substrate-binding domain-containing protein [Acetobacteraceae bacterium]|nr:substrate-binding domain-containing protein [Acetobacteraceae bacterium]